ncbi:nucleotidyltransferase domain-containing protein [Dactylosporangium sp. AC04546]|uniref:nucleotidyltransferase domain-containing protein n=1 Tax=Dactylosporangium sp. AC04546 TaxID=2862460 RepID=UPI001EE0F396|nr:nucleotidyltransferase domain-containing protein [Dactylosporangium sp. AC04546]WVK81994.1 nucleotidyltransferase domain-containing protein [Dactylosporangium sp. AC04546]
MDILGEVMERAGGDPNVLGVVLTGSQARGMAGPWSDVDVTVVVEVQDEPWRHDTRTSRLDEVVCTVDGLADTSVHWRRYGFRGAKVLLDRLGGGIAELVGRQATLSGAEAAAHAREMLGAYVNQVYRAVKSYRNGDEDAGRLDAAESVAWLLECVFAMHGRLRPYNKYLQWELDSFPLPGGWNAALRPGAVAGAAISLFGDVEGLARERGHGDVLDGWGTDIDLIRAFRMAETSALGIVACSRLPGDEPAPHSMPGTDQAVVPHPSS